MKNKNDLTLKEAMSGMINELKLKPGLHETKIKSLWAELMGKTIDTYTSDIVVRKGVLYLTIQSSPLKQELMYSKEKIVNLLNDHLGENYIKEVIIR